MRQAIKYILSSLLLGILSCFLSFAQKPYNMENKVLKATIDSRDGSLTSLRSKNTSWDILQDSKAGRSFEASIKLPDGRFFVIDASSQEKPEIEVSGNQLSFTWKGLKADDQKLDIDFTGTIRITNDGLIYGGTIANNSNAVVEQLCWPFIGEITIPEDTQQMLFQYMTYTSFGTEELYPAFKGRGWSNLPEHAFTLIHNKKQGLYLSSMDHEFLEYIRCEHETIPKEDFASFAGQAGSKANNEERLHMRTRVRAARMLYLQPGSRHELSPFIITPYTGDWHAGVDIYKKWRETWFNEIPRAEWLSHVNSWQQLQINSAESRINFRFKDLKKYVDECVKYGVDAIQLTGWAYGGQDRGMPCFDPDPRLGTLEELKEQISYAKKKGVKILPFTKFPWVDLTMKDSKKWLPYIALNQEQDTCIHPGYNYYTYTNLEGVNTRRYGVFCNMDAELRQNLCKEFQKVLDLGAAGMVFDENQHHAGVMLCFSPNHGHEVPGFNYRGALLLVRDFYELSRKQNPDFLFTGEGCYDIQSQYYATYTRQDYSQSPVLRYLDPDIPIACAVIDHRDFNHVNMCAALRYSISYEPRNFKGRLSEIPEVMEYGMKVDALREKYEDYLWNGIFSDTIGATVEGSSIKYSVFTRRADGKKAVVVYNVDTEKSNKATVRLEGSSSELMIATPECQDLASFSGEVELNPQSMAVIIEK
jgi:hypothetical protein